MTSTTSSFVRRGMTAGLAGVGLLTLAGCAVEQAQADDSVPVTTTTQAVYVDGTYSAEATYTSPAGVDTISVTLTLVDDVVTDVTATGDAVDRQAVQFQDRFSAAIAAEVVGKDIADLNVSRVAGASLTSTGFNAALEQIRSEALR